MKAKPTKKHPKNQKVTLVSPAGIPGVFSLPEDAIRTRKYVDRLYAALCVGRFIQAGSDLPTKPRFDAETEAEITERVREECDRRTAEIKAAREGLPNPLLFKMRKGKLVSRATTAAQRKQYSKHVAPLGFTSAQVRSEIEAEYV